MTTLVSALRTAIKARRRQYELGISWPNSCWLKRRCVSGGERLRLLWEAASLLLTAEGTDNMMRTLF